MYNNLLRINNGDYSTLTETLQDKIDFAHDEYPNCDCNTLRCHQTILKFKEQNSKAIQELREEIKSIPMPYMEYIKKEDVLALIGEKK